MERKDSHPRIKPPTPTSPGRPPTGSKAILFQPAVDFAPPVSSPKSDCFVVLAETCRVERAQVKQDTVFNTGEIDILLMAATAGCKLASQRGNNPETKSDIGGRVSLKKRLC